MALTRAELIAAGIVIPGSTSAQSFIPTGSNTPSNGLYLPATNTVAIATNSAGRLFIDANGRINQGTVAAFFAKDHTNNSKIVQFQSARSGETVFNLASFEFGFDGGGSLLSFTKSRSVNPAEYLYLGNNQTIGKIVFSGDDGFGFTPGAAIVSTTDQASGLTAPNMVAGTSYKIYSVGTSNFTLVGAASNTVGTIFTATGPTTGGGEVVPANGTTAANLRFMTTPFGSSFPQERLRITSSGRIGIGTTLPSELLHIAGNTRIGANGTSSAYLQIGTGATGNRFALIDFVGDTTYSDYGLRIVRGNTGENTPSQINHRGTGSFSLRAENAAPITFETTAQERLRITPDGKLGVATDSPDAVLTVNGTSSFASGAAATPGIAFSGNLNTGIYRPGDNQLAFATGGEGRLFIDANGRILIGTSNTPSQTNGSAAPLVVQGQIGSPSIGAMVSLQRGSVPTASGQGLGNITFADSTGRSYSQISGQADGVPSVEASPGTLSFYTVPSTSNGLQERLRIKSSGKMGLGTSDPINLFDVNGAVGVHYTYGLRAYRDQQTVNNLILGHTYTGGNDQLNLAPIGDSPTSAIALRTAEAGALTTRLFINPGGDVGILTESPAFPIDVRSRSSTDVRQVGITANDWATSFRGTYIQYFDSSATGSTYGISNANCGQLIFQNNTNALIGTNNSTPLIFATVSAERARINNEGNFIIGKSTSTTGVVFPSKVQSDAFYAYSASLFTDNSSPSHFWFLKSRGTAPEQHAAVKGEDLLGRIGFAGSDGDEFQYGAAIFAIVENGAPGTAVTNNQCPTGLVFGTRPDSSSTPLDRMRIAKNGYVGINCYPSRRLEVAENRASEYTSVIINQNSAGHAFATVCNANDTTARYFDGYSSVTSSVRVSILSNGNIVNINNSYGPLSSDVRLKQDIIDAPSQWDDLKNIRFTKFRFKNDPTGDLQLGLIAQELEEVCPGLVTRRPASEEEIADITNDLEDGDEVLSFKASILYMKAVVALQEAMERIEALEAEVAALKSA